MELNPYVMFDGNCEAAFKFYEQCLGGKIIYMGHYGDPPMEGNTPPELRSRIMHASLRVGNVTLMASDCPPGEYEKPQGMSVCLNVSSPAEAERAYQALAEGANIKMPLQETFWAARFAMLVDRFGIPWFVNCEKAA